MASGKVRTAIVGMGIGRPNGRALAKIFRSEVVALCDLERDRMSEFAEELLGDVKLYTDYKKLCRDPDIDAVFVGTPNQRWKPYAETSTFWSPSPSRTPKRQQRDLSMSRSHLGPST